MSKIYTVGQISRYVTRLINQDYVLNQVVIRGEISNCKYYPNGNIYFSLKDEESTLSAVMFSNQAAGGISFHLENGQAVLVRGAVRVYEKETRVQLYASRIELDGAGEGRLNMLYEQLKLRLSEEGLFDFEHKKPVPKHPKRVGIVTASTGAAIQDIRNIAHRRNPYVELILYPAKVQGAGAAETIVRGIQVLDRMGLDTIIIGRGGGSIEDLWAFNEEIVARAIYAAETPIISGTGHEVDNTIADYVADLRAPTPSAAAELAIPDVMTTLRRIRDLRGILDRQITGRLKLLQSRRERLSERLNRHGPENELRLKQLRWEQLAARLHQNMRFLEEDRRDKLERLAGQLDAELGRKKTAAEETYREQKQRLAQGMDTAFFRARHRAELLTERLHGVSPTAKLKGGFGYIESPKGAVRSVKEVSKGDQLKITMHDGAFTAKVEDIPEK